MIDTLAKLSHDADQESISLVSLHVNGAVHLVDSV